MIPLVKKVIQSYTNDVPLKNKFLISHLILIMAPTLIITILFFQQLYGIIVANTKSSEQIAAKLTVGTIEDMLEIAYNTSAAVAGDANLTSLLYLYNSTDLTTLDYDSQEFKKIIAFLNSTDNLVDGISILDIKIYVKEHLRLLYEDPILSSGDIFQPMERIKNSYWHGIFSSTESRTLLCPPLYLTSYEKKNCGMLSITRQISFSGSSQADAYVSVYFNQSELNSLLHKSITLSESAVYIINERDALVASSNSRVAGRYMLRLDELLERIPDTNEFFIHSFSNERCYISYKNVGKSDWHMITVIPVSGILSENKAIIMGFLGAYLIVLLFACAVSLQLSSSIVRRISTVIQQMKLVKSGTLLPLNTKQGHDEIGELIETYNYMVLKMNHMYNEQLAISAELRTAEFKALQAQINPHFLYNTLDMINWLSMKGLNKEVSEAIQALSKFYKLTLRKGNVTVTVEEELEHVSLYVQLQNMRYKGNIHFTADISDEIFNYTLPKIIFQPVVENAIQHGILAKESKEGNIVIMGWMEDDILIFLICDDGIGIPEENLRLLLTGRVESQSGSGMGVWNTHKRLQLFYNTEFGLSYSSKVGKGTEVEIRIPAVAQKQV